MTNKCRYINTTIQSLCVKEVSFNSLAGRWIEANFPCCLTQWSNSGIDHQATTVSSHTAYSTAANYSAAFDTSCICTQQTVCVRAQSIDLVILPDLVVECFEAIREWRQIQKCRDVTGNRNHGLISAVSVSCDVTTSLTCYALQISWCSFNEKLCINNTIFWIIFNCCIQHSIKDCWWICAWL